jgi:hypothetical protein
LPSSTPEPSALTRIFTSLSIARFTGTRIFMMGLTGYSIGFVLYGARSLLGKLPGPEHAAVRET